MKIMVTGGAGFIGANFLNLMVKRYPEHHFIVIDKLTYAANPLSLSLVDSLPNYVFEQVDIAAQDTVLSAMERHRPDWVIHFAAESHVDRSIAGPRSFVQTNIVGTFNLLEACRSLWTEPTDCVFHQVSTDEVYGSLGDTGAFTEETRYDPSSPYSATKAAGDHLVRAYHRTFGLPVKITNCSNNYGPYQFPEKLIPLMILNAIEGVSLPVYGQGRNIRDWLYVEDHCEAIWLVAERGKVGETYNIGGNCEKTNLDVVRAICAGVARETGRSVEDMERLIRFVPDRPGHDLRYAVDTSKIRRDLGWNPGESFESGLEKTIRWYLSNKEWVRKVKSGEYRDWIEKNYGHRS